MIASRHIFMKIKLRIEIARLRSWVAAYSPAHPPKKYLSTSVDQFVRLDRSNRAASGTRGDDVARSKFAERLGVIVESGGDATCPPAGQVTGVVRGFLPIVARSRTIAGRDREKTGCFSWSCRGPVASRRGERRELLRSSPGADDATAADPLARGPRRPVLVGSSISRRISGHRALLCLFLLRSPRPLPPPLSPPR